MSKVICPGQDTRFWRPGDIFDVTCANCGTVLEFFKDEARRKCPGCKNEIKNPRLSLGCAQWCEHAKECLGFDPKDMREGDTDEVALVDQLIAAMKGVFGDDTKRIDHAFAVLRRAQEIIRQEQADPRVVMAAAILHDIGIKEAEKKHGSSAGKYQETEGPPIARRIMEELGLDEATIDHVVKIVANLHSAKGIDTPEFRIIWDADRLVNLPFEFPDADRDSLRKKIEEIFKTAAGKKKAYELLKSKA